MDFGSSYVYAPKQSGVQEFEHIPESRYNHIVTGYASSAAGTDYHDDGEVCRVACISMDNITAVLKRYFASLYAVQTT